MSVANMNTHNSTSLLAPDPEVGPRGRVYCFCFLHPYRGSQHDVVQRTYFKHFRRCRDHRIPFNREEARHREDNSDYSSVSSQSSHISETEYGTDDEHEYNAVNDHSNGRTTAGTVSLDPRVMERLQGLSGHQLDQDEQLSHRTQIQAYQTYFGITRAKRRMIRKLNREIHGLDEKDPVTEGQKLMDDMFGGLLDATWYNCCPNGHMAFTGVYASCTTCRLCNGRQFDDENKPTRRWQYIPLIPRLAIQFQCARRSRQFTTYRKDFRPGEPRESWRDVFDGDWFRECWASGLFQDLRDLAIRISLDGIGLVNNPRQDQAITPVVIFILNLHPTIRDIAENTLTSLIIPGSFSEEFVETLLYPLMDEFEQLRNGISGVYDGDCNATFVMRAHPIMVTGDGQAIAVNGL